MTYFRLDTNVSKDKVTSNFLKCTSKLIANVLQRPEKCVVVQVVPEQPIHFCIYGELTEPCGYATLISTEQLGIEPNKKHTKAIQSFLMRTLGIPKNRLLMSFIDSSSSMVGYNGSTFD